MSFFISPRRPHVLLPGTVEVITFSSPIFCNRLSCTPRNCVSPFREGRGCTPRSCVSPCREGRGCTPCSCVSASRGGQGLHSAQLRFNFPWGQGLHSTQSRFSFPCEHRFPPVASRVPRYRGDSTSAHVRLSNRRNHSPRLYQPPRNRPSASGPGARHDSGVHEEWLTLTVKETT